MLWIKALHIIFMVTWFAGLFHDFAATLDSGDSARPLADIAQVAAVLEASYAAVA